MNKEELKTILPHREPMLLVEESTRDGEYVYSKYTVKEDEFFTNGHFPGFPVVPGVILCEMMAQGSVLLIPKEELDGNLAMYAGLDGVKFKNSVYPGDVFCTQAKLAARRGPLFIIDAKGTVNGKLCVKGQLTFMLVPNAQLGR